MSPIAGNNGALSLFSLSGFETETGSTGRVDSEILCKGTYNYRDISTQK